MAFNKTYAVEQVQALLQGYPVPAVAPAVLPSITTGAASASCELEADTEYDVIATEDCYYRLGPVGGAALTTDMYLPAKMLISLRSGTVNKYLHAIQVSGSGFVRCQPKRIAE